MGTWNDFLWPLIVLTGDQMYTLPVALANLLGEHANNPELMMAGSLLTLLPIIIVFLVFQKFYIRGNYVEWNKRIIFFILPLDKNL